MAQKNYERVILNKSFAAVAATTAAATTAAAAAAAPAPTAAAAAAAAVAPIVPMVRKVWMNFKNVAFSDRAAAKVMAAAMTAQRQIYGYLELYDSLIKYITFPHIEHLESLVRYCLSPNNRPIKDEDLAFVLSRVKCYERDGQISVKEFTNWINWINKMREMIDHMWNMFYETTWHGDYLLNSVSMTSTDAEKYLKGSPAYTFVLYWSHTCNGNLAVSYIKKNGEISHQLISYEEDEWVIKEDGKVPKIYPDLKGLIENCDEFQVFTGQVFTGNFQNKYNFPKQFMAPSLQKGNQMFALNAAKAADSP